MTKLERTIDITRAGFGCTDVSTVFALHRFSKVPGTLLFKNVRGRIFMFFLQVVFFDFNVTKLET